jgi:hypothetical protein
MYQTNKVLFSWQRFFKPTWIQSVPHRGSVWVRLQPRHTGEPTRYRDVVLTVSKLVVAPLSYAI